MHRFNDSLRLFTSSGNGIVFFNVNSHVFFSDSSINLNENLASRYTNRLLMDNENLWIASDNGIFSFSKRESGIKKYVLKNAEIFEGFWF